MICPFCERELRAHVFVSGVEVGMYCPDCHREILTDMLIEAPEPKRRGRKARE